MNREQLTASKFMRTNPIMVIFLRTYLLVMLDWITIAQGWTISSSAGKSLISWHDTAMCTLYTSLWLGIESLLQTYFSIFRLSINSGIFFELSYFSLFYTTPTTCAQAPCCYTLNCIWYFKMSMMENNGNFRLKKTSLWKLCNLDSGFINMNVEYGCFLQT